MTSDSRHEAFRLLFEVCSLSPDVRLGQLFSHFGFLGEAHLGRGLAEMDDDELTAIMQRHKTELEARAAGVADPIFMPPGSDVSVSGSPTITNS